MKVLTKIIPQETKQLYVAEDGKEFYNPKECLEWEVKLAERKYFNNNIERIPITFSNLREIDIEKIVVKKVENKILVHLHKTTHVNMGDLRKVVKQPGEYIYISYIENFVLDDIDFQREIYTKEDFIKELDKLKNKI